MEMFNKHYINIVEKTSGITPKNLGILLNPQLDQKTICEIVKTIEITPPSSDTRNCQQKTHF